MAYIFRSAQSVATYRAATLQRAHISRLNLCNRRNLWQQYRAATLWIFQVAILFFPCVLNLCSAVADRVIRGLYFSICIICGNPIAQRLYNVHTFQEGILFFRCVSNLRNPRNPRQLYRAATFRLFQVVILFFPPRIEICVPPWRIE